MTKKRKTKAEAKATVKVKASQPERESGAQRASIGTKIDTSLVPYELICAAAAGLNYDREKYSARNWEKGLNQTDLINSVDRHTRAIMGGEHYDAHSGLPHFILLASSVAMFVSSEMRGIGEFDIPEKQQGNHSVENASKLAQIMLSNHHPLI